MKMNSVTFYCLCVVFVLKSKADETLHEIPIQGGEIPKIAIIGAGIGGSSCAYFLRDLLGDKVQIDVYEAGEIGGRLATREYEGHSYEVGGAVIHNRNRYMNYFRNIFYLEEPSYGPGSSTGIYDKNGIQFIIPSEWTFCTYVKILWRYWLSILKLDCFVNKTLDEFDKIYEIQDQGESFETVEELLGAASPNFLKYFDIDSEAGFSKYAKINKVTIDELVKGSLKVNYGQSTNVHLFVGSVSISGITGGMWAIKGGNKLVPESLIASSAVNLINNKVTKIVFHPEDETYIVESVDQSGHTSSESYKFVVLAHPITDDRKNPIEFVNFPSPIQVKGKYQPIVTTILSGDLNGDYFGIKGKNALDAVINNDDSKVINSVGRIWPVTGFTTGDKNVWKIFSERPLSEEELNKLFSNRGQVSVVDWLAYPQYNDLGVSRKFILNPRLYYINAIEWAASAMEMSVIGARNVALLIAKELFIPVKKVKDAAENQGKKSCTWWRFFFC